MREILASYHELRSIRVTTVAICEKLGVAPATLYRWLAKENAPSPSTRKGQSSCPSGEGRTETVLGKSTTGAMPSESASTEVETLGK